MMIEVLKKKERTRGREREGTGEKRSATNRPVPSEWGSVIHQIEKTWGESNASFCYVSQRKTEISMPAVNETWAYVNTSRDTTVRAGKNPIREQLQCFRHSLFHCFCAIICWGWTVPFFSCELSLWNEKQKYLTSCTTSNCVFSLGYSDWKGIGENQSRSRRNVLRTMDSFSRRRGLSSGDFLPHFFIHWFLRSSLFFLWLDSS